MATRKARLALALPLIASAAGAAEAPQGATCPFSVNGALEAGDLKQSRRLFRSDGASTCQAPQPCEGSSGAGPYLYDQYTFVNREATSCVTVSLASHCGTPGAFLLHASAYINQFIPGEVCTDYIADIGESPGDGAPKSFSFEVPPGARFIVVVSHVAVGGTCRSYVLDVTGCEPPESPQSNSVN